MRTIKFRAWDKESKTMIYPEQKENEKTSYVTLNAWCDSENERSIIMQFTELTDKNGKEIYFGDKLRFSDKWEWYKGSYGIKMYFADEERLAELQKQYEAEPYEERVVEGIEDYEWLLSSEIQQYWEVIGNIHENPELLK